MCQKKAQLLLKRDLIKEGSTARSVLTRVLCCLCGEWYRNGRRIAGIIINEIQFIHVRNRGRRTNVSIAIVKEIL